MPHAGAQGLQTGGLNGPSRASSLPQRPGKPGLPNPAASAPVGSSPATSSDPAKPAATDGLTLSDTWRGGMQGGSHTLRDIQTVMAPHGKPAVDLSRHDEMFVLTQPPIRYLEPRREAIQKLPLASTLATQTTVATPGFPRGSLVFYSYDTRALGQYNKLCLVVDRADQVVAVQLLAETPRAWPPLVRSGFTCYNFVQHRVRTSSNSAAWHAMGAGDRPGQYYIDSQLVSGGRLKEVSRTYLTQPMVDLILHCASLNATNAL